MKLFEISDIAKAINRDYSYVYSRIRYGLLPWPTTEIAGKRRRYYNEETFKRLVAELKELQTQD